MLPAGVVSAVGVRRFQERTSMCFTARSHFTENLGPDHNIRHNIQCDINKTEPMFWLGNVYNGE
jgi:hypothetical protein